MGFQTRQIKGQGRGHKIGFPTINLFVPEDLEIKQGIYACIVTINNKKYKGALHYGVIPTFEEKEKTMEVHLLDVDDGNAPNTKDVPIEIEILDYLRDIWKFSNTEELAKQIMLDVEKVRSLLK